MTIAALKQWFPHIESPLIISAPMRGGSNSLLVAEVTKAGGFGILPASFDFSPSSKQLEELAKDLSETRAALGLSSQPSQPLPVGIGFILSHKSSEIFAETVMPILQQYKPSAAWLFAPAPSEPAQQDVISALKASNIKVFVQVGTVAAAREAAIHGADVIVAQGTDAGGHQFANGAGIVSLVPEIKDMLSREFGDNVSVIAAGGIVDGRGVAAALTLGADGVVMGTRFLIAKESSYADFRRKAVIEAVDGAVSTAKSTFHDEIQGTTLWAKEYDGRAIISKSYEDSVAGMSLEENRDKFAAANKAGDNSRSVVWAGTGVGLVNEVLPAGEIVRQARDVARQTIKALQAV